MNRADYRKYLASEDWRTRREPLIIAHGSKCKLCGIPRALARIWDGEDLHFHHYPERYAMSIGQETPEDGEPRCRLCHGAAEGRCPARTFRDEVEWVVIGWLCLIHRCAPGRSIPAWVIVEEYAEIAKEASAGVRALDFAFASAWRRSVRVTPADLADELVAVRNPVTSTN